MMNQIEVLNSKWGLPSITIDSTLHDHVQLAALTLDNAALVNFKLGNSQHLVMVNINHEVWMLINRAQYSFLVRLGS